MKRIFGFLVIFLILAVSVFAFNHPLCRFFENNVKQVLDDANYCNKSDECKIDTSVQCPYGCYRLINKDVNLTQELNKVQFDLKMQNYLCPKCIYGCAQPPAINNIYCVKKKCVDIGVGD
jgi:hypothetical protein